MKVTACQPTDQICTIQSIVRCVESSEVDNNDLQSIVRCVESSEVDNHDLYVTTVLMKELLLFSLTK